MIVGLPFRLLEKEDKSSSDIVMTNIQAFQERNYRYKRGWKTASFVYIVRRCRCLRWDQDLKKPQYHHSALIFEVESWRQNSYRSIS